MDFIALDVETANPNLASICQIGIVEFQNSQVVNQREWLVDPEDYFYDMNVHVHGIHEVDVRGQPTWQNLYPAISECLSGRVVVSHTTFDRTSLSRACHKYQMPRIECSWVDSARVVRKVWSAFSHSGHGLSNVAAELGIPFRHHNAKEDARTAGEIMIRAVQHSGVPFSDWLTRSSAPMAASEKRVGNVEGVLFGEVVVFTGALTIVRSEAANLAAQAGCAVVPTVRTSTTLLVVGDQDISRLAGHTKSSKHRKAEELIAQGQSIRILGETDFLALLSSR